MPQVEQLWAIKSILSRDFPFEELYLQAIRKMCERCPNQSVNYIEA